MNQLKSAAIVVCLAVSVTVPAQKKNSVKTKFPPPVIVKDNDSVAKSEATKNKYKSKQWHQGLEISDENKGGKVKSGPTTKPVKSRKVPPPPVPLQPPTVAPPTKK